MSMCNLTCELPHPEEYCQDIRLPYALYMIQDQISPRLLLSCHACTALARHSGCSRHLLHASCEHNTLQVGFFWSTPPPECNRHASVQSRTSWKSLLKAEHSWDRAIFLLPRGMRAMVLIDLYTARSNKRYRLTLEVQQELSQLLSPSLPSIAVFRFPLLPLQRVSALAHTPARTVSQEWNHAGGMRMQEWLVSFCAIRIAISLHAGYPGTSGGQGRYLELPDDGLKQRPRLVKLYTAHILVSYAQMS